MIPKMLFGAKDGFVKSLNAFNDGSVINGEADAQETWSPECLAGCECQMMLRQQTVAKLQSRFAILQILPDVDKNVICALGNKKL